MASLQSFLFDLHSLHLIYRSLQLSLFVPAKFEIDHIKQEIDCFIARKTWESSLTTFLSLLSSRPNLGITCYQTLFTLLSPLNPMTRAFWRLNQDVVG